MSGKRLTLIYWSVVVHIISACLFTPSYAAIDPKTMVGAWTLDEGSGRIAKDSSLYKNDGTLKSAPNWVGGHFDKALSFDGKTDYIDCGNHFVSKKSSNTSFTFNT